MKIIFVLLSFVFLLLFAIHNRDSRIKHMKNEIVIKARHQTVLSFRDYFNDYISKMDEKEIQSILVGKVNKKIDELTEEEVKEIVSLEFIRNLVESRRF